ncbi:MAG: TIGR00725 family protein, partial [Deltaproteobacteria bacterium]|nr:TIGR00725 family protein [Deltaproteobacteria bacterium]
MGRRLQIAVIGSSKSICTKKAYRLAEKVGEEIAKIGAVTVTGGGHGVMEAAMKGAKKHGGLTLGILPWEKMENHNKYCDAL